MRRYKRSGVEIDLDPIIDEALRALPYIRPEAEEWFRNVANGDFYARGLREGGTRIEPNHRVELGLEKWAGDQHISWEVWNALTDEARRNPARNFDLLCDRISCNAKRAVERPKDNKFLKDGDFFCAARFQADHRDPCEVAKATDRAMWKEIPEIPFGSCTKPVCGCSWRLLTERELAREQGRPLPRTSNDTLIDLNVVVRPSHDARSPWRRLFSAIRRLIDR